MVTIEQELELISSAEPISVDNGHEQLAYGVVSLLDVQRLHGKLLCALTAYLGKTESLCESTALSPDSSGFVDAETVEIIVVRMLPPMKGLCQQLGLILTSSYIERIEIESMHGIPIPLSTVQGWMRTLQGRLEDELHAELLFHIGRERARFWDYETSSQIASAFPSSVIEFGAAGRCLAYGEGTATVFHLMRIIDSGLRAVADSLPISYDARNWHGIGSAIESEMAKKYQTLDWKKSEPFYASVLTNIAAIGRGHRNPALHELETKYTESEAEHIFVVTEGFMHHLADNDMREVR